MSEDLIRDFLFSERPTLTIEEAGGMLHLCGALSKEKVMELMLKLIQRPVKASWRLSRGLQAIDEKIWDLLTEDDIHLLASKRAEVCFAEKVCDRIVKSKSFQFTEHEKISLQKILSSCLSFVECSWYKLSIYGKLGNDITLFHPISNFQNSVLRFHDQHQH